MAFFCDHREYMQLQQFKYIYSSQEECTHTLINCTLHRNFFVANRFLQRSKKTTTKFKYILSGSNQLSSIDMFFQRLCRTSRLKTFLVSCYISMLSNVCNLLSLLGGSTAKKTFPYGQQPRNRYIPGFRLDDRPAE